MDVNLSDLLKAKMSYNAERQKVLAENIASVDTPGYKANDLAPLDFNNLLAAHVNKTDLAITSPKHLPGLHPHTQTFKTFATDSFERKPTGGTVVIEEQMMKVSKNAADYQLYTSLYKKVGNLFKSALGLQPS